MAPTTDVQRRQYVWLVRYGRTDPPLRENIGNFDSDLHNPDGLAHATSIAKRLASGHTMKDSDECSSSLSDDAVPKTVYSDPFLRCMRTADVVVKTLSSNNAEIKIRVEEGTTEWQVPSLLVDKDGERTHPRTTEDLVKLFLDTVDVAYRSVNPQGPDRAADGSDDDDDDDGPSRPSRCHPPRFPETEEQLHRRCQCTIRRILATDVGSTDSFVIVGHAPCVQSMALALMGGERPEDCPELGPWSLGGMTLFSRSIGKGGTESDKWTLEFYSDTTHMPGEYNNGQLGRWSLPSFDHSS